MKVWRLAAVAAFLSTPGLASAQSGMECRNRYDATTAKVYYGCAPKPQSAGTANDVAMAVTWVEKIEENEGLYVPRSPFASPTEGRAERQFSLISQWATQLGQTTDQATAYFATAVNFAALAQLHVAKGQFVDARDTARKAVEWIARTQAAYDHH